MLVRNNNIYNKIMLWSIFILNTIYCIIQFWYKWFFPCLPIFLCYLLFTSYDCKWNIIYCALYYILMPTICIILSIYIWYNLVPNF